MKPGHAYAWGGDGKVPAHQAFGGQPLDRGVAAAGGMPYEGDEQHRSTNNKTAPNCVALKKDGSQCGSWAAGDSVYCQGHLNQLEKLNEKIASCEDEAERLLLEEERFRKWL